MSDCEDVVKQLSHSPVWRVTWVFDGFRGGNRSIRSGICYLIDGISTSSSRIYAQACALAVAILDSFFLFSFPVNMKLFGYGYIDSQRVYGGAVW